MLILESYSIYVTQTNEGVRCVRVKLNAVDSQDSSIKKEVDKTYNELANPSLQSFLLECDQLLAATKSANGVS